MKAEVKTILSHATFALEHYAEDTKDQHVLVASTANSVIKQILEYESNLGYGPMATDADLDEAIAHTKTILAALCEAKQIRMATAPYNDRERA